MAKFVFQLRAVLRQREGIERQRQLALAAVEQERLGLEAEIRVCQEELVRERESLRSTLGRIGGGGGVTGGARVDLRGVRMQSNASLRIMARAQQAAVRLAGVHQRLEIKRRELLEATTGRKAIETLRHRRLAEWKDEQKRREMAVIDEIAVMRGAGSGGGLETEA